MQNIRRRRVDSDVLQNRNKLKKEKGLKKGEKKFDWREKRIATEMAILWNKI